MKTLYIWPMILDTAFARQFAGSLLQINAIQLQPQKPFLWSSGWRSPIYCDNRLTLSFPKIRREIALGLTQLVEQLELKPAAIAGVATGGIPHGLLLAEQLQLPFLYVRSKEKTHGKTKRVEGMLPTSGEVLVVEDLISTGGSGIDAVQALRNEGAQVHHLIALFSYGFPHAQEAFQKQSIRHYTLSDYETLLGLALETGRISNSQWELLQIWRTNPAEWNPEV